MYVNDRDQINYHGFLKALREMQGVSLKQVAEGICSDSEVCRVEIGDRLPEKLMRDRITSRLGVSGEEYEEYLRPEEYRQWEIRMYILDNINKGDVEAVQKGIEMYDEIPDKNPVMEQFIDTMRYMLAQMKGASKEILSALIELAVVHTIPDVSSAFLGGQVLADQELNLIAEYTHLREYYGAKENEFAWRFSEYLNILEYIDHSYMDTIGRSKVYPRTTCYICEWILNNKPKKKDLELALELCIKSIELLRDASRLYYFIELLEYRKEIIRRLLKYKMDDVRKNELQMMYEKDCEWEALFKELYEEYEVPVYMKNFTYLYVETECNNVVEVIRTRRNMLKLSRVRVSDNICTDKTIERFENYVHSPSIAIIRDLFERIGLCAEYKRARVITDNAKALYLSNELIKLLNDFRHDEMEEIVEVLRKMLHMDIAYNMQEILRNENLIEYSEGRMDKKELEKFSMKALECTLPIESIVRMGDKYFTRSEISILYDIAFETDSVLQMRCVELLQNYCKGVEERNIEPARICVYELLMSKLASYYGNKRKYDESNEISNIILKECLSHRRMVSLAENLYNNVWNHQKENCNYNKDSVKNYLQRCILLSEIIKKDNWMRFFEGKIYEMENT